jgi:malate dehydrogenase (oxaloacetate-decarboxylating)
MNDLAEFQQPFVQKREALAHWNLGNPSRITLLDVIYNAKPTALIGVSAQTGAFTESVVRAMAKHNKRPIIFPLSNPSSCAEAMPADIERWSEGRAIIGAGSPFPPITRNGKPFSVDQSNNSYIFPGVGLGAIATHAKRITDKMFMAAAKALAEMSPARTNPEANLLPRVTELREVAIAVAIAVGRQAHAEGLTSGVDADGIEDAVRAKMWTPRYLPYRRAGANT